MAFATDIRAREAGIVDHIKAAFKAIMERVAARNLYNKTYNELSAMSDRDLADIGMNRSMIKSVSYEAAYGE